MKRALGMAAICASLALTLPTAMAGDGTAPRGGKIAYVATEMYWSVYQTPDGKAECPNGLQKYGPREVFATLYPKGGPEADTHLRREALKFFPEDSNDKFPIPEAVGPIAIGLNLDGKVGPRDFTSPTGEKGIDNQLYRLIGCSPQFRAPEGQFRLFANRLLFQQNWNRTIIELTGVDSLVNDDEVVVNILRGKDPLMTDATGDTFVAGGTQRVDTRFAKRFERQLKGKIVDGVLITEPADVIWPLSVFFGSPSEYWFRGMRLQLKLSKTHAKGLLASYADIDTFYRTVTTWSTHHLAYGQLDPSGFYKKLKELADGYPDENGRMTAISSSIDLTMTQVYLDRGGEPAAIVQSR